MSKLGITLALTVTLAACGQPTEKAHSQLPPLPGLKLRPMLDELKAIAAQKAEPDERTQRELREYGDIALNILEADTRTTMRAERALLEHEHAWFVLEPALAHDEVAVRQRAAWLCGVSQKPLLQLTLLKRLRYEQDAMTLVWIADALCKLGNDTGIEYLRRQMKRGDTQAKAGELAMNALRDRGVELPESPTWDDLDRLCLEATAKWRRTGLSGLQEQKRPDKTQLHARLAALLQTPESYQLRPVDDARFILRNLGQHGLEMMVMTLQAEELKLRTMPLQEIALVGLGAKSVADDVMALLGDKLTSLYAIRTLSQIGATQALPHIRPLLEDPETELRAAATQAVGVLGDEQSRKALEAALADDDEVLDVRVNAAFALLCLGEHQQAEQFLAEREANKDYHEATLTQLRERLAARKQ